MKNFIKTLSLKKAIGALVVVLIIASISVVFVNRGTGPTQQISDDGDIPRGDNAKPDLMIYPRLMPARPNSSVEVDVTYTPNETSFNQNPNLLAASFVLSYPKDLVQSVSFTPTAQLDEVITNSVNDNDGTVTFKAVNLTNNFKFFSPKSDNSRFLGRLRFTTKGPGAAKFTFLKAEMGFNFNFVSPYYSSETNSMALHGGTVFITSDGKLLANNPIDALPPQPSPSTGTVVLFSSYTGHNGYASPGRQTFYQDFNDANNNGIHDVDEDYNRKDGGQQYRQKDPLLGGVSFTVTGPFVLSGSRFTQEVSIGGDGYGIMRNPSTETSLPTMVDYTLSKIVVPEGYYISSMTYPFGSPTLYTRTPSSISFSVHKNILSEVTLGISKFKKISGTVFTDTNGNGTKEDNEVGRSGVSVKIQNSTNGQQVTVTTSATGEYSHQLDPVNNKYLYTITATPPTGFVVNGNATVTIPSDNISHVVNFALISSGSPTINTTPGNGSPIPTGGTSPTGGAGNPSVTTLAATFTAYPIKFNASVNPANKTVSVIYRWGTVTHGSSAANCGLHPNTIAGPTGLTGSATIQPNATSTGIDTFPEGTKIYYCASIKDSAGNMYYGSILSFTTGTKVTRAPTSTSPTLGNASPPAGGASLKISVKLPGIGTAFTSDNKNPVQPNRIAEAELVGQNTGSGSGATTPKGTGELRFDGSAYTGFVTVPSVVPGYYQVKVRLNNTIYKLLPGVHNLNSTAAVNTQPVTLSSGDFNRDNSLDLYDYNIILACVRDEPLCTETFRALADLNSDGETDPADFNVFLKQLDVRAGD